MSLHTLWPALDRELVLVRVQDDLHGAFMGPQGLTLPYRRDHAARNTLHFSLNCIVQDHPYGAFNLDQQGALKGKIILLADPREMGLPAGFGQVDAWYRLGAKPGEAGAPVQRSLALGFATIVAPKGTAIPEGAHSILYEGGLEARDAAAKLFFDAYRIPMEHALMRCWQSDSEQGALAWARETVTRLYGAQARHVHTGGHESSVDAHLESLSATGLLQSLRQGRLGSDSSGGDVPYLALIEARHVSAVADLGDFLDGLPPEERRRIGAHYEAQIGQLQADLAHARALDAQWRQAELSAYKAELGQALAAVPGQGDFYVARLDNSAYEQLGAAALAQRMALGALSAEQRVWRAGLTADWTPLGRSPLAGLLAANHAAPEAPAPQPLAQT